MQHSLTPQQVQLAEWIFSEIQKRNLDESFHAVWGTGLSPVDRPILVRSNSLWQIAPFSFGDFSALEKDGFLRMSNDGGFPFPKGVEGYAPTNRHYSCTVTAKLYKLGENASAEDRTSDAMNESELDIFISHTSADSEIASLLIDLLRAALNIAPQRIRCTSVDGYRLPGGAPTDDSLKREVRESRYFIALVTPRSVKSTYVLFELGARWGAKLPLTPLLAAGLNPSDLEGPVRGLNALDCASASQLHQLISEIAQTIGTTRNDPAAYDSKLQALKSWSDKLASLAESEATSGTKLPAPEKRELSDSAKQILDLIMQEPEQNKRGIVVIQKEIQPGIVHFFPKIQYAGTALGHSSRSMRIALAELVENGWLYPPEENPSRNTTTYELIPRSEE
jgi:hypothetical protein